MGLKRLNLLQLQEVIKNGKKKKKKKKQVQKRLEPVYGPSKSSLVSGVALILNMKYSKCPKL